MEYMRQSLINCTTAWKTRDVLWPCIQNQSYVNFFRTWSQLFKPMKCYKNGTLLRNRPSIRGCAFHTETFVVHYKEKVFYIKCHVHKEWTQKTQKYVARLKGVGNQDKNYNSTQSKYLIKKKRSRWKFA